LPSNLPTGQRLAHHGALSNRMVDYRDFMARYQLWAAQKNGAELLAFNRVLSTFLDGFADVAIEERPLRLTVKKAGARLSLQQLSDGERAFIAVLGDLVRRLGLANPELANPLAGHGVVLIDELELHLHPRWQREVVEKLRTSFPNIQFIATTHSPFIIQSLRPGELITLDPEEFGEYANRSVEDIAEHVMGVAVPQKSERYLEMMKAAEDYYRLLRETPEQTQAAENRLAELVVRFSDDPAYQALLKLERAARQEGEHAARE
jgi:predicted ATP-binding protein involved in virulence